MQIKIQEPKEGGDPLPFGLSESEQPLANPMYGHVKSTAAITFGAGLSTQLALAWGASKIYFFSGGGLWRQTPSYFGVH